MKPPRDRIVIAATSAVCLVAALIHQLLVPVDVNVGWAFRGFIALIATPYIVVGLSITLRSPENRIGRMLQTIGLLFVLVGVMGEYGLHGLVYRPGSLPGAIYAAWVVQWAWIVMFGFSMFLFLQFPNGRYLSPAWRRFRFVAGSSIFVACVAVGLGKGPLDSFTERPVFQNPLGLDGWPKEFAEIALMPWLICLGAATISLFIRFRGSRGTERLQLKWLAVGGLFTAFSLLVAGAAEGLFGFSTSAGAAVGQSLVTFGIALLPTTIGLAILKYRLYDIDVLINRALVYGSLTVALAGAYVGLVFAFQALMAPFTAESDLAIAASTLAVAALFRPGRARLQDFIDKRFYRRKFDAERTVAEFGVRLRDEVELSAVISQLTDVVQETMAPTHVSLWTRPVAER